MTAADPGAVAVVFVNYHSEDLILPKLEPLRSRGLRVLVVDNSATMPEQLVDTIRPDHNLGFGAAVNYAEEHLPDEVGVLCLHNPDVDIDPRDILGLADTLASRGCGAVAPLERTGAISRAGFRYPSATREVAVALRNTRSAGERSGPVAPRRTGVKMRGRRFASGALLLVDRAAHRDIGGFDTRYFLYGEDLDYWHRLQLHGWGGAVSADVVAIHRVSSGSPLARERRELLRWLGVELFMESHGLRGRLVVRAAHRLLLPRLGRWPGVTEVTREAWRRGASAEEVMGRVRAAIRESS